MPKKREAKERLDVDATLEKLRQWLVRFEDGSPSRSATELALVHLGRHDAAAGVDSDVRACDGSKCLSVAESILLIHDHAVFEKNRVPHRLVERRARDTQVALTQLLVALEGLRPFAEKEHGAAVVIGPPGSPHRHELFCERPDAIRHAAGQLERWILRTLDLLHGFGDAINEGLPNFRQPSWQVRREIVLRWLTARLSDAGFTDRTIARLIVDGGNIRTAAERVRKRRSTKRGHRIEPIHPDSQLLEPLLRHLPDTIERLRLGRVANIWALEGKNLGVSRLENRRRARDRARDAYGRSSGRLG